MFVSLQTKPITELYLLNIGVLHKVFQCRQTCICRVKHGFPIRGTVRLAQEHIACAQVSGSSASESIAGSPASGADAATAMDCDSPTAGPSTARPSGVPYCSVSTIAGSTKLLPSMWTDAWLCYTCPSQADLKCDVRILTLRVQARCAMT